ncbi:MAG: Sigma 54 modulation protein/ribosomal protein S30EA [uncultured bacterium]|nr:MAG: Sigma 54 modulation protein/ribosomal protein S30EA [uncultured bacterium]OFW67873.1 MAG: ribosomal subunit interface protein [Alphaproteobacteria bacterium GWC2_42_16]OFW73707.1 MAG: ribosomal subunit interface protein [Alphaproteobacteria bacterium GWA2_41_27]OFW82117.1 MAG: ribosomal subunit interface protein [Alphaproteobacteria bacterium RIFCSPHIGHO2_12_FULL_42_100]OFW85226.1 MAG: ribosomal subunit interface protein [Alphaproteobacteria bacterium RBG_16_42_14]OFW91300.1 MAG: ribos
MQVQVTGKKIEVSDALRKQALEKIEAIRGKYHLSPLEASVTFSRNGPMVRCDVEMHLGHSVYVRAYYDTDEAYICLEQAIETFEKRLRRYKKKLIDHTKKRDVVFKKAPAFQYVIQSEAENESTEENPLIIAEVKTEIPELTVSEAVMRLDLSDSQALLFNNVAHDQLNVVYRRPDGNIGWISPSQNSEG